MQVTLIGIDLAKNIFQVCGVNQAGTQVFNKAVKRARLHEFVTRYPEVPIAMEACSGSNYWGREFIKAGHPVKLIPPRHVKPFVTGNKNDRNDAFAICEAARRPRLKTVVPRSEAQTDMMVLHRMRERLVAGRTAMINQTRGFLGEYGIVLATGNATLRKALPDLLEEAENGLTVQARECLQLLLEEWRGRDEQINRLDKRIRVQAHNSEAVRRLLPVKGVAELTATAVVAHVGEGKAYRHGRDFSASLGLVPRENSSGGKQRLGGITKRGNGYLRHLLIQGAWSILRYADQSQDRLSRWAREVATRRGKQKAVVAVANKLARILWTLLYHKREYQAFDAC